MNHLLSKRFSHGIVSVGTLLTAAPPKGMLGLTPEQIKKQNIMDRSEEEVLETGGDNDKIMPKRWAVSVVWRFISFKKKRLYFVQMVSS